ncbi:ABC transporter substrate-binding protein [Photobacterium leiognathi]|uniref:ABC transporter substrate-binding protein n=1 Tax=Photobacterium leiognathi TaxID=553611 RepID=UPI00387F8DD0
MKKIVLLTNVIFSAILPSVANADNHYPVTVKSCQQSLTFNHAPTRAVFNDLNMTQMALSLGLQPNMVAVSGISGWYKTSPEFKEELGNIPETSSRYLTLEPLLNIHPDFLFAGWNYGLKQGSSLTPKQLSDFGIKTLVLSESCAHINNHQPNASMSLLYNDILKLGKIFDKTERAQQLISDWKLQLKHIENDIKEQTKKSVFLYDSGVDKPFTSGRLAMPQALIKAAGGRNVMSNMNFSWGTTSWESVAVTDPDWIILVDYNTHGALTTDQLINNLKANPLMAATKAVKENHFIRLKYGEITPGPRNIEAIWKIATHLYPNIRALRHEQ